MNQLPELVNQPVHLQTSPPWRSVHMRQRMLSGNPVKSILAE